MECTSWENEQLTMHILGYEFYIPNNIALKLTV